MAILMDGKGLAQRIRAEIALEAEKLPRKPGLAVVLVGDDPASRTYVTSKERDCEQCGFASREYKYDASVTQEELLSLIAELNADAAIDGILVQLPLPDTIDEDAVIEAISPEKDVDAFHPVNVGRIVTGKPVLLPCTPAGIMELFNEYGVSLDGKICVMVGRSNIVGKPMSILMLRANGTVVCCHSHTPQLAELTRQADVLVVAAGHRGLISGDMVKAGAVVIDVAMNRDAETGKFTGDVIFDEVAPLASYITPVPGGVGPMTRAMLMRNILAAAREHMALEQDQ